MGRGGTRNRRGDGVGGHPSEGTRRTVGSPDRADAPTCGAWGAGALGRKKDLGPSWVSAMDLGPRVPRVSEPVRPR